MSGRLKVSEGDWVCTAEGCENLNFARRDKCNKCGEPKEPSMLVKNSGTEIGARFAEKSKGLFSANDWQCSKCGNINWARRSTCNVCNAPKVGPEEQRTGYGGGFKENENVTYKEKEDSDGEFDEFGRKKKKFRGKLPEAKTPVAEEAAPFKKVEFDDEDEDDDDDDDDDDVDLSKYALSDSDTENVGETAAPPPESKDLKRRNSRSSSSSSGSSSSGSSRSRSRSPRKRSRSPRKRSRSRSPRRRSRSPVRRSRSPLRRSRSPYKR